MSFVEAFHSFRIDLTHADRSHAAEIRCKVPKFPSQTMTDLYATMIAYCHGYRSGLQLVAPLPGEEQAAAIRQDVTGEVLDWVTVGVPSAKLLRRLLKRPPLPTIRVYFTDPEQPLTFCRELRGSVENWVAAVQFYQLDHQFLTSLEPLTRSKIEWALTFVDELLYLNWDDRSFESEVASIDIWSVFQRSIGNVG